MFDHKMLNYKERETDTHIPHCTGQCTNVQTGSVQRNRLQTQTKAEGKRDGSVLKFRSEDKQFYKERAQKRWVTWKPSSKILSDNIKLKAEVNSYKQKPAHTRSYTCTLAVHPPQCLRYEDKDSLWTLTFKALLCWKLIPQRDPKCPSPPNTDRCAWTIAFHKYRDI